LFDISVILVIIATFLFAGTVKGVIGLGLPTVSLAILTVAIDLPTAMALLLVPSLVTNVWQAASGGNGRAIVMRIWPFLLMAGATVWLGATALTRVDLSLLSACLGILLFAYSALSLSGVRLSIASRHETWVGPLLGIVNGILTGMTGSFVVPGVLFLQSIGFSRDVLIQAMGILFTISTLALALALGSNHLLSMEQTTISGIALFPAILGMIVGQRIRFNLSEQRFRRIFFTSLLLLGIYIIATAFGVLS
jgi:uncharacterized membrane protein YfcA